MEEEIKQTAQEAPEKKPKKKRRALKVITVILLMLLLLLVVAVTAGIIYVNIFLNKIDRTEITGDINMSDEEVYAEEPTVDATDSVEYIEEAQKEFEDIQKIEALKDANIDNILLIGTDRTSTGENGRSDSMILVTLNYDTGNIHLTSLMRAIYVCIPKSTGDVWGMLNASYSWGGPKLLIDTVELNFRIDIDHYVVVDFEAFKKAVDILGGVDIDLTAGEAGYINSVGRENLNSGLQHLNGKQALIYARIRLIDNDFVRTSRQRTVIQELMKKATNATVSEIMEVASEILPLVNTNLTNTEILSYAFKALPMLKNPITERMIPFENESGKTYTGMMYVNGMEMYKIDFESTIKELHEFMMS